MQKVLFVSLIAASLLTGCSAVYQSGQTPDDLYYSPGREISNAEVRKQNNDEERYQQQVSTIDDRYLRMKVSNRNQWSSLDDYSYWNDMRFNFRPSYSYNGFNNYYGHPYLNNPWNGWGYGGWGGSQIGWNNPLYTVLIYTNPKVVAPTYTSGANLAGYRNKTYNNYNSGNKFSEYASPGNSNGSKSFGSLVRSVISSPSNGNGSSSYDRPARSFQSSGTGTGSSSTSSSAGGSSGGFGSSGSSASSGRAGRGN
jgi:hypothetical protein